MKTFTVQLSYAAYYFREEVVEAETLEELGTKLRNLSLVFNPIPGNLIEKVTIEADKPKKEKKKLKPNQLQNQKPNRRKKLTITQAIL